MNITFNHRQERFSLDNRALGIHHLFRSILKVLSKYCVPVEYCCKRRNLTLLCCLAVSICDFGLPLD